MKLIKVMAILCFFAELLFGYMAVETDILWLKVSFLFLMLREALLGVAFIYWITTHSSRD